MKQLKYILMVLLILVVALGILFFALQGPEAPPVVVNNQSEHYCSPESRNAEICTMEYGPVCGWFDPVKIQCIKYPCAQEYSNGCVACTNANVLYWTAGECPK